MDRANSLQVRLVETKKLKSPDWNPRYISAKEMEALKKSISEFGLVQPLVVNRPTMEVLGGNQRLAAAQALGIKKVPVVFVDLPEAKAKALNVALNKIEGEFDLPALAALLRDIQALDPDDLLLTGFDDLELAELLGEIEAPKGDEELRLPDVEELVGEKRSRFFRFNWGDVSEATSRSTYEAFVDAYDSWTVNRDGPTIDRFIQHLLQEAGYDVDQTRADPDE